MESVRCGMGDAEPERLQAGDEHVYSNSEYDVLGSVIERVSGQLDIDFGAIVNAATDAYK